MWVFDGHLDLAMNALVYERDQTVGLARIREREAEGVPDDRGTATVALPELRAADVRLCLATLLARAKPWVKANRELTRGGDWPSPAMAHAVARGQLAYYELLEQQGQITIVRDRQTLSRLAEPGQSANLSSTGSLATPGVILTLEGADPIVHPLALHEWHRLGVRTLMLAHFGRSHYAHGSPSRDAANEHDVDGPLTAMGRELLDHMSQLRMALDLTHLSDTSFAEAVEQFSGPVYSSHSGCRAVANVQRNHTDEQLRVIIEREGVIGMPLYNGFLYDGYGEQTPRDNVTLEHVADHVLHICDLAGSARHVALGSDLDGGFGRECIPAGIDTHRDIGKLADVLASRGLSDDEIAGFFHSNWMRFWREHLP